MASETGSKHERSEATRVADPPEPSFAERARTLLDGAGIGTLSTLSRRHPGYPFGSIAPYGVLPDGRPTFLLSSLAVHTQNFAADPRASLLVAAPGAPAEALASPRVTLVGTVGRLEDARELDAARADYLARHEEARAWAGFGDFAFYRLDVAGVYWVAGFGAMGWVDPDEYCNAAPDPLSVSAAGILAHMNADHRDALVLYCRVFAGVDVADGTDLVEMIDVDRLGFRVRIATAGGARVLRIAFTRPVASPDETRKVLVEMVREARAVVARGSGSGAATR